jgi:large subunit ribosomal protein L23Ae
LKNIKAKVQKALKEEKNTSKAARKVWNNVVFRRPRTQRLPKQPKYPRRGVQKRNKMDKFAVLKYPLQSENVMRLIEEQNTLVFIVNLKSGKKQIKTAFKQMYDAKVETVRTLIRPTGEKKAFIKLVKKEGSPQAIDVASKIGLV